ncbi:MAG: 2-iminoacetate synthase ThiH [Candidatus Omnitrophica bacterium]|nr:2-iminoacetate synthase ThiH [Candidatus Omnitrophota bacterium]
MSFIEAIKKYESENIMGLLTSVDDRDIDFVLNKNILTACDFLKLLSPSAFCRIEDMAVKARDITLHNFGRAIQLYTPLYVSDFCDNDCIYCGYNAGIKSRRRKLTIKEVKHAACHISNTGLRHILLLTGDSKKMSPVSYISDCVEVLKEYFSSVAVEVYPLSEDEYAGIIKSGADSLTVYQETYDRKIYSLVHRRGDKTDYAFRLEAPERALRQNIRAVNIGALLGLNDFRVDGFFAGLHAHYLQANFPAAEISVSVPRIRQTGARFVPEFNVTDADIAQLVVALRIFLPRVGITLSTRESAEFRDNMLALGITRISAQSATSVSAWLCEGPPSEALEQFSTSDKRTVSDIKDFLKRKGYQPVFKDWMDI